MTLNELSKIQVEEFVRRLKYHTAEKDKRYALFIGAGCSVSSEIPDSALLVRDAWLPRLRDFQAPHRNDLDEWVKEQFPEYDPKNPATLYGKVMEKLFLNPEERQREIETALTHLNLHRLVAYF